MTDSRFNHLRERYDRARQVRREYESQWSSIRNLVRPNVPDFFSGRQDRKSRHIYDGTAPWALEQLASGLHSYTTNGSERWFGIGVSGMSPEDMTEEQRQWLDRTTEILYREYQRPESSFDSSLHETFLELSGFGTSPLFQDYSSEHNCLYFRAYPLGDIWVEENAEGRVDVCFRRTRMTFKQLSEEFPDRLSSKTLEDARRNPEKKFEIIHAVLPRSDRDPSLRNNRNMPFASFFFCEEWEEILHEGGYESFPYHIPRWTKLAGEVYGQSPAGNCLPDIQMVNQMVRTILTAAQKASDPPVIVPNSGFLLPIRTSPGSIIYKEPGTDPAEAFPYIGQPEFGLEMINQHRNQITRAFYIEHLLREQKKERQSIMEIQDERMEMLQQLGPVFGRINSELLGPMILRSLALLLRNGVIEEPPFEGGTIRPFYTSAAARSQMSQKSMGVRRFIEGAIPLGNIDPELLSAINFPQVLRLSAHYEDIPPSVMRSEEEVAQMEAQRQEAQQMQQAADLAGPMASATRDLAEAQRI